MRYDVAVSFAGEDRSIVEQVVGHLVTMGIRVFYDYRDTHEIWGKDLYTHLSEIYQNRAIYCLMFVSRDYVEKEWPSHERKAAQARALVERKEYILPVKLDETEVPGLLETTAYLRVPPYTPKQIALEVAKKLARRETISGAV